MPNGKPERTIAPHDIEFSVSGAIATIYESVWPMRRYDFEMYRALVGAIVLLQGDGLRSVGVVARNFGRRPLWLIVRNVGLDVKEMERAFLNQLNTFRRDRALRWTEWIPALDVIPTVSAVFRPFSERTSEIALREGGESDEDPFLNYCALFYSATGKVSPDELTVAKWIGFCGKTVVPMLFDVFRQRERRMMPFASEISELYWMCAADQKSKHRPPWDSGLRADGRTASRETVTLSIDLRKSTFCMDQAYSAEKFGQWLDGMVGKIIDVSHSFGGVFDKFTGDGGLMHFLEDECRTTVQMSAIVAATECARKLTALVYGMLPSLRVNLRNDSELLGAGIAIALGDAFWAVDHRDNPIVVGHGVVDACRICDSTPAGGIRLSNIAYWRLVQDRKEQARLFRSVKLGNTKDHSGDLQITVWEMSGL